MTKEQILQKHFTAEFGHDGHGKFMQYILDAMEEYAQQQVKNLNIPAVMVELPDNHVCRYSKAMNQPCPRLCVDCGKPEGN
jgi:hypothetical protein